MNALKIKKSGWMWKLALFGGMPQDGQVTDRNTVKFNRLVRAKYDANEISYDEKNQSMRDTERPIDFCDFTRFILFAFAKGLALAALAVFLAVFAVFPVLDFFYWVVMGFLGHGWEMSDWQKGGACIAGVASGIGLIILIIYHWNNICRGVYWVFRKAVPPSDKSYKQVRLEKAQAAYNRSEVAKAFFQSVKGKTCFKMEVTE